jgi:hypothetical protein
MSISLSKEDTNKIIYESIKNQNYKNRYTFKTMYPWKCLKCLAPILISYKQFSNIAIFCSNCKHEANNKNKDNKIIQYQYMRVVKENQLKLVESFLDKIPI